MKVADLYWNGKLSTFNERVNDMCPPEVNITSILQAAAIKKTGNRDGGISFDIKIFESPVANRILLGNLFWRASMEIEVIAKESADRVSKELERVKGAIDAFRGHTKNDLASLKATSDRVKNEVTEMSKKYDEAVKILTSSDFEKAILNAERLADAMKVIQLVSDTKINVAIFGDTSKSKNSDEK